MDFGTILVNTTEDYEFALVNASDCDVQYELHHLMRPEKLEVGGLIVSVYDLTSTTRRE